MRGLYIKRIFGRGSWTRSLLPPLRASSRYGSTSGHGAPPPGGTWRGERREGRRGGAGRGGVVGRAGGGWRCVPRGGAVGFSARRGAARRCAAFGCAERRQRSAALRCARRSDRGGGGVGGGRSRWWRLPPSPCRPLLFERSPERRRTLPPRVQLLVHQDPPAPSPQGCSRGHLPPVGVSAWDRPDPNAAPCARPSRTSLRSHGPPSPACPGPSG